MLCGSYNIPYGYNFAEELAKGILQAYGASPQILAQTLVFLPTSRSCQSVKEAFLRISEGKATLMPRLIPLGEPDEDDILLATDKTPDIRPAIPPLKRQILLTELITKTRGVQAKSSDEKISFDQALRISQHLSRLLDDCYAHEVDLENIKKLAIGEYAEHWQPILTFLDILFENWPHILTAFDVQDAGARHAEILNLLSIAWQNNPPRAPIIAAAINRNIPSVRRLLKTIHQLPQSAVVFQGLEHIDSELWQYFLEKDRNWFEDSIAQSSPFWINAKLLEAMDITPQNVSPWLALAPQSKASGFIAQSLRPPACALKSQSLTSSGDSTDIFDNLKLVECENSHDEAMVIAMMMRSQLENEGKTAALVTADRTLAQKVRAQLRRWQLNINDSAGISLSQAPIGIYLNLSAQMIGENFKPRSLVAFLKHPFTRLGLNRDDCRRLARHLDYHLRDMGNISGLSLILQKLAHKQESYFAKNKNDENLNLIIAKLNELRLYISPLKAAMAQKQTSAYEILHHHIEFCEWAATGGEHLTGNELWKQEAGEAASQLISALFQEFSQIQEINGTRWAEVLNTFLDGKIVRPVKYSHPRLFIWGMVESRIQQADLTIIGGFNEGNWPQIPDIGPWLSRPMRAQMGMAAVEEEVCLNAADFMNLAAAPQVIITRALHEGGKPTIASRWLSRIEAQLQHKGMASLKERNTPWLPWMNALMQAPDSPFLWPAHRPAPIPPLAARPKSLSVTRIEDLIKDSYSIYASKILGFYPLDSLEQDKGALEFGNLAHDIVEEFVATMQLDYGSNAPLNDTHLLALRKMAEDKLKALNLPPHQESFWSRRLMRLCESFFASENRLRGDITHSYLEVSAAYNFSINGQSLTVTGKADRIDKLWDNSLRIVDYKTGQLPSEKDVTLGRSPQMTLEAIMAQKGGFSDFEAMNVQSLLYWQISGNSSAKEPKPIMLKDSPILENTENLLYAVIEHFADSETPYFARPYGSSVKIFGNYDHLSRFKEWASSGDDMDE